MIDSTLPHFTTGYHRLARCIVIIVLMLKAMALCSPTIQTLPNGDVRLNAITIHPRKHSLSFPARFALKEGALEVIIATPNGRLHETLLVAEISAQDLQTALLLLGAKNGTRIPTLNTRQGSTIDIRIAWQDESGKPHNDPIEDWIIDNRTGKTMRPIGWIFVGSIIKHGAFEAESQGNLVINWSHGATILDTPDTEGQKDTLHKINEGKPMPPDNTVITVIMHLR